MLTESFIAATLNANKPVQHLSSALKDVGIFVHELHPQNALRQGFKKSSAQPQSLAVSRSHVFAAQSGKAVLNVYNRQKGNQEATVPFPEKITSVSYANGHEVLILGTEEGKLVLWEVGTGRITTSTASHLQGISHICVCANNDLILSGSPDSSVHIWSVSKLLSFQINGAAYSTVDVSNAPEATFSQHHEGISALTTGHSRRTTNFAVSASNDRTCHIWHIDSREVIRTILLPTSPTCVCLDHADRAIYLSDATGNVTNIDILALGESSKSKSDSASFPVQVTEDQQWRQSSDGNAAHAIALSYDGTALLTGHMDGSVLKWDVAKRKVTNEVAKLGQPVTNLHVLRPDGLQRDAPHAFVIPEVIKPKLEFNAQLEHGSSGVPATYKFHAFLTGSKRVDQTPCEGILEAISSDGWEDAMLHDAIGALQAGPSEAQLNGAGSGRGQSERLGSEIAELKKTVAAYQQADLDRMEQSIVRMRKRADIDLKRREVYHASIKRGDDKTAANAAMKAFVEASGAELAVLDAHSDDEAFGERMDTK